MAKNSPLLRRVVDLYHRFPVWSNIILVAVTGFILVWVCLIFLDVWTHHGDNATVPEIKNQSFEQATQTLAASGLSIEIADSIYDDAVAPGYIVESWPKAGSVVKAGRSVYVTITAFSPKEVTITRPITGVSARQAISYLNSLGLSNVRQVSVPSQYPDLVISATVNNRSISVGSMLPVSVTVTLEVGAPYVAPEPEPVAAPDSISAEDAIEDEFLSGSNPFE